MTQFNDRVTIYQYMDATRRNNIQTEQIECKWIDENHFMVSRI